jgi:hypothetical protein
MKKHHEQIRKTAVILIAIILALVLTACDQSAEEVGEQPPAATDAAEIGASQDNEPLVIESGGEVPFYARIGENETISDGEWTVIVFYRQPECIPADFNLNQFFHFPDENSPGAFGCAPPTTTGVETWQNGPETDPAPLVAETTGRGAVPIWFIAQAEIEEAMADGELTIGELAGMPSLLKGTAASYDEYLRPSQSNSQSVVQFTAEGTLADGGSFTVDVSNGAEDVADHITIELPG